MEVKSAGGHAYCPGQPQRRRHGLPDTQTRIQEERTGAQVKQISHY
jgi:hypothetical protein